jgi:hypothetical protein
VPGATVTYAQARKADGAALTTAQGGDLTVKVSTGSVKLKDADPDALVVEVRDTGTIEDPLIGRTMPDFGGVSGRGIWMANQLCSLVQVRSGRDGTQVRLHTWL